MASVTQIEKEAAVFEWLTVFADVVAFLGNLTTFIVGGIAIYGIVFRRKEISDVFSAILQVDLNVNVSRIKETLGRLESLNYDVKENRGEINALIGQLCGQLIPVLSTCQKLEEVHAELQSFMAGKSRLTESKKRKLIYETHGHLDRAHFRSSYNYRKRET